MPRVISALILMNAFVSCTAANVRRLPVSSLQVGCEPKAIPMGGGSGTAFDPWMICAPEHLKAIDDHPNDFFVLESDLEMSGVEFEPLAQSVSGVFYGFSGQLNGQGYSIRNLSITTETCSHAGFIGDIANSGIVQNLNLLNPIVTLACGEVASLAGVNRGVIKNVHVSGGELTAAGTVGGLVGSNYGQIFDSSFEGLIIGGSYVGGLIGSQSELTALVARSRANSQIVGASSYAGGLIGVSYDGTIDDSLAEGSITGSVPFVGGMLGGMVGGDVRRSESRRLEISSKFSKVSAGGFVGIMGNDASISNSRAFDCVINTASLYAAGFVGTITHSSTRIIDSLSTSKMFAGISQTGFFAQAISGASCLNLSGNAYDNVKAPQGTACPTDVWGWDTDSLTSLGFINQPILSGLIPMPFSQWDMSVWVFEDSQLPWLKGLSSPGTSP